MNSNRLAELIINPASCSQEEVLELSSMAELYPYSAAIHILNAKLASIKNTDRKDSLLTRAAIIASDRMQLKQYITSDIIFKNYTFIKSETNGTEIIIEPTNEIIDESPVEESEIKDIIKETEVQRPDIDTIKQPGQPEPASEKTKTPVPGTVQENTEKSIKPVAGKHDSSRVVIHEIDTESLPKTSPGGHNVADEIMKNLASYREAKAKFENILEGSEDAVSIQQEYKKSNPEDSVETGNTSLPSPADSIGDIEEVEEKFKEIIKPIQKKKTSRKLGKEEQDKLISKFMETDASPAKQSKPGNREKQSEGDLSLPSTELKDEMITETLANILVNQGKLEKAIDIYRKLIWKLPQKKAYFAAKIESLKERLSKK